MSNRENIRKKYYPSNIKILLIGESPPSGGSFFYNANSNLFRAVKKGFEEVYGEVSNQKFLYDFKNNGFYLDDLCLTPVNGMDKINRKGERKKGIKSLSRRIANYEPEGIIIVMKAIKKEVLEAVKDADLASIQYIDTVSFPAGSEKNRKDCIEGIKDAIVKGVELNILKL